MPSFGRRGWIVGCAIYLAGPAGLEARDIARSASSRRSGGIDFENRRSRNGSVALELRHALAGHPFQLSGTSLARTWRATEGLREAGVLDSEKP